MDTHAERRGSRNIVSGLRPLGKLGSWVCLHISHLGCFKADECPLPTDLFVLEIYLQISFLFYGI